VILVLLWRDNIIESWPFLLHHRQTLSTGLLNSLKKQEVCLIHPWRNANTSVLRLRKVRGPQGHNMKCFSATNKFPSVQDCLRKFHTGAFNNKQAVQILNYQVIKTHRIHLINKLCKEPSINNFAIQWSIPTITLPHAPAVLNLQDRSCTRHVACNAVFVQDGICA
jgi:hypothetical protein